MRGASEAKMLRDVADMVGGGTPDTKRPEYWNGSIPWVSPKDMKSTEITDSDDHITEQALQNSAASVVKAGAVLVVVRSGILARTVPMAIARTDLSINQDLKALVPRPSISTEFLYYALQAQASTVLSMASRGATVHRLPSASLMGLRLQVPDALEQHRIVAVLDQAFAAIATARANTERNMRNALTLFESRLEAVFALRHPGWSEVVLGDVATFTSGLWKGEKPPFVRVGVIRNTNFTKDGVLDDGDIAFLDVEVKQYSRRRLQSGDIILEKSGGGPKQAVGRVVLFDKTGGDFSLSNFTSAIRIKNPNTLDAKYLHLYLHWLYLSGATESMQSHSTGIRNLSGEAYRAIKVPYPNLEEQERLAGVLGQVFLETRRLSGVVIQKLRALDELKQSILHQAFAGSL